MILETLVVSPFMTNCYLVGCEETKRGAVIDPGDDAPRILSRGAFLEPFPGSALPGPSRRQALD